MEHKELNALIALLDDPDKEVFSHVSGKLMSYGSRIIPTLETVWEGGSFNPMLQERIENIIHKIQFDNLCHAFKHWTDFDSDDLFEGACMVSRYQYPDFDQKKLKEDFDRLKRTIWLELSHHLTPLEQVNIFNHVLYTILEFSPKASSRNFFLHKALENKTGNALMMGVIYLIIARDLDMPVYGVNLPGRFIMAYTKEPINFITEEEDARSKILFYINPLNRGAIFSRNELVTELDKRGEKLDISAFVPCSNKNTVGLLLENLLEIYKEDALTDKMEELNMLMRMLRV
ncbi:MAG: transglutaminase-like domain-containing protein [Chitinophagales bacterium]|nr:transglutaminase-like domain-containing protein [Chitinophagales bacterium]